MGTSSRSNNGCVNSDSRKHVETIGSHSLRKSFSHLDTYRSHIEGGTGDDEIELVLQNSRKSSTSPSHTTGTSDAHDVKEGVRVTTNVTVVRDVLS